MIFIKNTILHIASFFEKINGRMSIKFKEALVFTYFLLLVINQLFVPVFIKEAWWMILVMVGEILTFLIFVANVKSKYFDENIYRWDYLLFVEIMGISFLFSALYFRTLSYLAIGLLFSVALPIMHIIIAQYGTERFFISGAKAIVVSYVIFLIASFLGGPPLDMQYSSFLENSNTMGYFLTVVSSAVLLLLYKKKEEEKKTCLGLYVLLASIVSLCFFTASRTSLISISIQIVCFALLDFALQIRNKVPNVYVRASRKVLLFFVLLLVLIFMVFSTLKNFILNVLNIDYIDSWSSSSSIFGDIFSYLGKGIEMEQGNVQMQIDVDSFTSGRQGIWKDYFEHLSMLGHASEEREIVSGARHYSSTNAHNVYLQLAYSAGIPAGIAMILLMIFVLKDIIKGIFRAMKNGSVSVEFLFVCLCTAGFIFPSLTSSGYMMFTNLPATMFWLALSSLTVRGNLSNA